MNTLNPIKEYFHRAHLRKKLKRADAQRAFVNMETARKIGILFDATDPNNSIIVTRFSELLKQKRKTVTILGYVDDKKPEQAGTSPLFYRKDLNWYLKPLDEKVQRFISQDFDILINAFIGDNLPLEYISALSKAKYRVGTYHESKTYCFELMINLGEKRDLNYLLKQISHYLNLIHTDD